MSQFPKLILPLLATWIVVLPSTVRAQNDVAGTLYGQGVEAFFAGRSSEADSCLSRSISVDPNDPRAYYFRSLIRLRDGRESEARADMQAGAAAEAQQPNRFAIGKSLERVQGQSRLLLEQYRTTARMSHAVKNIPPRTVVEPDTAVLRERRVVPLDEFLQPGAPRAVAVPEPAPAKASPPVAPAAKAPPNEKAAPAAPAAEASPFGDDASPETPANTPAAKAPPAKAPLPPQPKGPPPAEKPAGDDNPFL